jgi:hypothetical protein
MKLNLRDDFLKNIPGAILKPGPRKQPRKPKVTIKEKDLQSLAENLCIALGIRFFRIPDKLMGFLANYAPPWVRVFVARYFQGVPDLMLFKPIQGGDNVVRFIEVKANGIRDLTYMLPMVGIAQRKQSGSLNNEAK